MNDFWNRRYLKTEYAYGKAPNFFFQLMMEDVRPGKILLPADGEGRNGVFAAKLGWEVVSFDYSFEAKAKALQLAKETEVNIDFSIEDIMEFDFQEEQFDAVCLCFVHVPIIIRNHLHKQVIKCLKPGGVLIFEGFSKNQVNYSSGGPKDEALLFSKVELLSDFKSLRIERLNQSIVRLEEGPYHQGTTSVIRMRAFKQNKKN